MAPIGAEASQLCVAAAGTCGQAAEKVVTTAVDAAGLTVRWQPGTPLSGTLAPAGPAPVDRFLRAIDIELAEHNAHRSRLRLRIALHLGDPESTRGLLAIPALADALDEAPDATLAVLVSDRVPRTTRPTTDFAELHHRGDSFWLWTPGWRPPHRRTTTPLWR
ncbi:hypothetical protein [Actinokineospora globicatena]|uniref:hypothetical protein n=1 Tax=Actinokineospora globicatena TaxID=103729 RepID=UPI0020A2835C|nr:hypothetical protein [Actinokineospora globicatena]MCP2301551.1 hypothetical protein [Actinokineospora globicatena]GLW76797.1 hypothetical protein Aglo01_12790 [Actinokineospora globicatena]GLW83630.1 hypothetical protein Aglo02_12700 [Actinokineospora globicatena]